jgi:2-octaprenyl-6-methoxyphenol hydroxylase
MREFDIAVVGAGLAGSLAALALADSGRSVALIAPSAKPVDGRTTALMDQSITFLKALDLWADLEPHAAALRTMQILDGTSRLLRAPPVAFRSSEVGLAAFGYNIPNAPFHATLDARIAVSPGIDRIEQGVTAATVFAHGVEIVLEDGERVLARLVVGADGRKSRIRESAGIGLRAWSYPQAALVLNFSHERLHGDVSTEFHTESGPFTQVPLPGRRCRGTYAVHARQGDDRRAGTELPALRYERGSVRQGSLRARRRGRPRLPAHRRAGPEPQPARHHGLARPFGRPGAFRVFRHR